MDDLQRPADTDMEGDNGLSRRAFTIAATAGVAAAATAANAQAKLVSADVKVTTPDGVVDAFFVHPAGTGAWPAVLIWVDAFGLRPAFRDMASRLAAQGYSVLVPNPFYRSKGMPVFAPGSNMTTPGFRETFGEYRKLLTPAATMSDTKAYLAWLDKQAAVKKSAKVGVQGYCMGGPMTFQSAAALPDRVGGIATFHGGGLVTETPDSPHLLIAKMNPKVGALIAIADNDDKNQPTAKDVLKKTFADEKRMAEIKVYDGCAHGWTVKDGAVYNEAGAEDAWAKLSALYKAKLV